MCAFTATAKGSDIEPIPEGIHIATCYALYDMGTTYDERWKKSVHKLLICWEIPSIRIEVERDGKQVDLPRAISKRYTLSLNSKANLRKDLEAWRGQAFTAAELEGFDLRTILGASCQLQVLHTKKDDGGTWANVQTIMGLPAGLPAPDQENPKTCFAFEEGAELPEGCPEWVQKIIMGSDEWIAAHGAPAPADAPNDPGPPSGTEDPPEEDNLPF